MKRSEKLKNLVFVLFAFAALFSVGIYTYLYRGTSDLVERTILARQVIKDADVIRVQGKDILALYDSTAKKLAQLKEFMVPSQNAVAVIQVIESIGELSKAAVTISSIRSVQPDAGDDNGIGAVSATVSVSGRWLEVMKALRLFENLPYENSIERVSLIMIGAGQAGNGVADSSARKWQLNFDMSVLTLEPMATKTSSTTKP